MQSLLEGEEISALTANAPTAVYVTFENFKSLLLARQLIKENRKDKHSLLFLKSLDFEMYLNPSSIIWENFTYEWTSKARKVIFWIGFLFLFLGFLGLCGYIQA